MPTREESQMAVVEQHLMIRGELVRAENLERGDHFIVNGMRVGVITETAGTNTYGQTTFRFKMDDDDIDPHVHIVHPHTPYLKLRVLS